MSRFLVDLNSPSTNSRHISDLIAEFDGDMNVVTLLDNDTGNSAFLDEYDDVTEVVFSALTEAMHAHASLFCGEVLTLTKEQAIAVFDVAKEMTASKLGG